MSAKATFSYVALPGSSNAKGGHQDGIQVKEGTLNLEDYREAEKRGMSVSAFVNSKYGDYHPDFGTAFEQGAKSLGIHVRSDFKRGITATKIADILSGECTMQQTGEQLASGGVIVAPSQQGTTPASRVFFPEMVMATMNSALIEDYSPEMAIWNRMISATEVIPTEMFTQPLIDVRAPRDERSQPIAQNTLPRQLVSITTSQYSKAIITTSIALEISEQAQQRASIDLVTTILRQQAEGEMLAKMWEDIAAVVNGNVDAGQAALSAVKAVDLDSNAGNGVITQLAWLTALYDPQRKVSYDSVICTLTDFLAIQNRTGRPLVYDPTTTGPNLGALGTYGLNVEPNLLNWSVGVPNVMLVPDGLWSAGHILMFDSRYALRRVVNSSASYSATEKMVLQRSDVFRFDSGSLLYRLRDEAFKVLDYASAS